MVNYPKPPESVCVDCGAEFHKPPSLKLIRCRACRRGMQGKRAGEKRKEPEQS